MSYEVIGRPSPQGMATLLDGFGAWLAQGSPVLQCQQCGKALQTADEREAELCATHLRLEEDKIYRRRHAGKLRKNYRTSPVTQKILKDYVERRQTRIRK